MANKQKKGLQQAHPSGYNRKTRRKALRKAKAEFLASRKKIARSMILKNLEEKQDVE